MIPVHIIQGLNPLIYPGVGAGLPSPVHFRCLQILATVASDRYLCDCFGNPVTFDGMSVSQVAVQRALLIAGAFERQRAAVEKSTSFSDQFDHPVDPRYGFLSSQGFFKPAHPQFRYRGNQKARIGMIRW